MVDAGIALNESSSQDDSGCSIMVVYAVWDGAARVRFPAPRQIENNLVFTRLFSIVK